MNAYSKIALKCIRPKAYASIAADGGTASLACTTMGAGTDNVLADTDFVLASATQSSADKLTVAVWNNDFLLASLY